MSNEKALSIRCRAFYSLCRHTVADVVELFVCGFLQCVAGCVAVDGVDHHLLWANQLNGQLASAAYDKELKKHADEFKREMAKIDNKSAYLREVFKRINLASNEDERKQAMSLLSDLSGYSLSEQEFTDFINGKKQIEL